MSAVGLLAVGGRRALGGEPRAEALERHAHLGEDGEVEDVHVRDEDAPARVDLDEALALEPLQRLAHGRPADVEPVLQLALADDRARRELQRDDELPDRVVRAIRQRLGLGRLGLVHFQRCRRHRRLDSLIYGEYTTVSRRRRGQRLSGANGRSSGGAWPSSTSGASSAAVAGASVTPSMPCPVATKSPSLARNCADQGETVGGGRT